MKMKLRIIIASLTSVTTMLLIAWSQMTVTLDTTASPWLSVDYSDEYISLEEMFPRNVSSNRVNPYVADVGEIPLENQESADVKYVQAGDDVFSSNTNNNNDDIDYHDGDNKIFKNKILIFTSYRTGSTFTGELFKQNPDVFYLFEPLKLPSLLTRDNYLQDHLVEYLDDCFRCKFDRLVSDSRKFYPVENGMRKAWVLKIFEQAIERYGQISVKNMEEVCQKYKIHAIKIIRGNRIQDIFPLMEKGLKVIHLVRDPRGTITSRLQIESLKSKKRLDNYWASSDRKYLNGVKSECLRYLNTYEILQGKKLYNENQEKLLLSQYRLVRYEDIAYNPEHIATELYKFLNLSMPEEVKQWLAKSTSLSSPKATVSNSKNNNKGVKVLSEAYSTSRNSSATAEAWRTKMPFPINLEIQRLCGDMLRRFGYRRVYSRTEYKDLSMSFVRNSLLQRKYLVL